ncbi:MAG: hypothetical protein KDD29_03695 [Flavobacteriales bacterium]|nr:hypothetical protein [Flavobacteriales bacterium]
MESYLIMHGDAELNIKQKEALVNWFKEQYKGEKKIERSWTDLIDNKKWQTNVETTEGIDRMRALLKANRNVSDVEFMNKLGEDLMQEIKTIFAKCTMTGLEHEMLHQYLKVDIHNIQGFIEIKQLNEGDLQTMQGMILNLERNFNTYHNFFETAQND